MESGKEEQIPIEQICRGRYQPRRSFEPEALEELAASIRQQGLIQPIAVRRHDDGGYELLAGERRWRACQRAGLQTIRALVYDLDDESAAEVALVENVQREDLNAVEVADGIRRLIEEFGLTQAAVADRIGKKRVTVANLLRLLQLDEKVQAHVVSARLAPGVARAFASRPAHEQRALADNAIRLGWTARQAEQAVQRISTGGQQSSTSNGARDRELERVSRHLSEHVSLPCTVERKGERGYSVKFDAANADVLQGLFERLGFTYDT